MLTIKTSLGTQSKACPDTFGLHAVRLSLKNDFFRLNKGHVSILIGDSSGDIHFYIIKFMFNINVLWM